MIGMIQHLIKNISFYNSVDEQCSIQLEQDMVVYNIKLDTHLSFPKLCGPPNFQYYVESSRFEADSFVLLYGQRVLWLKHSLSYEQANIQAWAESCMQLDVLAF